MIIGSWGPDLIFEVSGEIAKTYSELTQKSSGRWAEHNTINSKPLSEFLGPGLDELEMIMKLTPMLGVDPKDTYEKIRERVRKGEYHPMIFDGKPLSGNFWYIKEITGESSKFAARTGKILWMELSIALKEYN